MKQLYKTLSELSLFSLANSPTLYPRRGICLEWSHIKSLLENKHHSWSQVSHLWAIPVPCIWEIPESFMNKLFCDWSMKQNQNHLFWLPSATRLWTEYYMASSPCEGSLDFSDSRSLPAIEGTQSSAHILHLNKNVFSITHLMYHQHSIHKRDKHVSLFKPSDKTIQFARLMFFVNFKSHRLKHLPIHVSSAA